MDRAAVLLHTLQAMWREDAPFVIDISGVAMVGLGWRACNLSLRGVVVE